MSSSKFVVANCHNLAMGERPSSQRHYSVISIAFTLLKAPGRHGGLDIALILGGFASQYLQAGLAVQQTLSVWR